MRMYLILLPFLSFSAFAIDLVIGGKTYYIQKYQIEDDGKRIIIPYTIHLSEEAFDNSQTCEAQKPEQAESKNPTPAPQRFSGNQSNQNGNSSGAITEAGSPINTSQNSQRPIMRQPSSYNRLLRELDGQYKKLTDGLRIKKKSTYKQDFR